MLVASFMSVDGSVLWDILTGGTEPIVGKCDGMEFDFRRELCCVDQLYPRETGTESCCGYKLLDTVEEKCCHGFVIQFHEKCHANPLKSNES
ncbi:hypothetical protein LSAT2_009075 [Lamellibrachia satsuma]|nr:hypothetical protein LSAT2_009075 [Lamellibrachia satsuma]